MSTSLKMPDISEFTEDLFFQVAKYPIKASQLLGVFPLSLKINPETNNLSLHFNWSSLPCIGSICQVLFLIGFAVMQAFVYNIGNLKNSQFDGISLGIMATFIFGDTLAQRILGLFSARKSIDVWKIHRNLWSTVFHREVFKSSTQERLKKVGSTNRLLALIILASAVFYLSLILTVEYVFVQFYSLQNGFISISQKMNLNSASIVLIANISGTFFTYLRPLGILWVTIFPQIHCVCLDIIIEKIHVLKNKLEFEFEAVNPKSVLQLEQEETATNTQNDLDTEKASVIEIVEMYHATAEMIKQYNRHFSAKLLLEILYSTIIALFFSYFILFWVVDGKYLGAAINVFPVVVAFGQIQHLGNVGSLVSCKTCEVLEVLHRLQLSTQRLCCDETNFKVISLRTQNCVSWPES